MRGKEKGIYIKDVTESGRRVRLLLVDGAIETAMFLSTELRNELFSAYLRRLEEAFVMRPGIRRTLLLGGGGFAYPRFYLTHYPDCSIDVVERDAEMIRIARESFSLGELEEKYGDAAGARLRIFAEEGMDYLLRCRDRYDFIVNDAFKGWEASGDLNSDEGIRLARLRLRPGGIYAVNVVTASKGPRALPGARMRRRLLAHLRNVTAVPCRAGLRSWEEQNTIFFASDEPLI